MKRTAQLFFVTCFLTFLFGVAALTLLMPKAWSSYYENRSLTQMPTLTAESFLSGDYFDSLESYLTDHVPFRSYLLKLQTLLQLEVLRQPVVSDVLTDSDVLLGSHSYNDWDTAYLSASAQECAAGIGQWADAAAAGGGQLYYVGLPEQTAYFVDRYPDYWRDRQWLYDPTEAAMEKAFAQADMPYLSFYERFRAEGCPEALYFASDHHYTVYGALAVCQKLLRTVNDRQGLSLHVPAEEDLAFTTLPNPFLGSRNRKLFCLRPMGDALTIAQYRQTVPFRRWDNGTEVAAELFLLPETAEETVSYTVFMGGDKGETVVDTDRPDLPSVLIIGESYTNAMETLLYASFDEMRSIDPRSYQGSIADYIALHQPEVVIVLRDNTSYFTALSGG